MFVCVLFTSFLPLRARVEEVAGAPVLRVAVLPEVGVLQHEEGLLPHPRVAALRAVADVAVQLAAVVRGLRPSAVLHVQVAVAPGERFHEKKPPSFRR